MGKFFCTSELQSQRAGLKFPFLSETSTTAVAALQCENLINQLPMSQLPGPVPVSTMSENSAIQNQAPTAVPNWNPQVPPFIQNVPQQPPAYNVSSPIPAYNVSSPIPAYNVSPSAQVLTVPTAAPQWTVATAAAPNTASSSLFYQTFLKGKPKALGIVLIVSAILELVFGIALAFSIRYYTFYSGIAFWGPVFYIIAGSLTIAAHSKPNLCLIRGSLSLNILSSIVSTIAVILTIIDVATVYCYYYPGGYHNYDKCRQALDNVYGLGSALIVLNLLLFCVSLSLSIFGCRSLSTVSSDSPQVLVLQNDYVVSMNPATAPNTVSGYGQPFPTANAPYVVQVKAAPGP
ncbi:membrane-spanning 4-domains subfamily A member 8-like [Dendropsophus ebraccatus]|uniref:membrane-spanning 4-domains subfamily A member 8-like n=1 Tax=Dendropsophus ebraccatus TaxID=150705 RepID=UPI003831298E